MSWKGQNRPSDTNVPDYQKMLQSHYHRAGWVDSRQNQDRYSPLPRRQTNDTGSLTEQRTLQQYYPLKYSSARDSLSDTTYQHDGKYGPLTLEDTVHEVGSDGLERTVAYGPTTYEYKNYHGGSSLRPSAYNSPSQRHSNYDSSKRNTSFDSATQRRNIYPIDQYSSYSTRRTNQQSEYDFEEPTGSLAGQSALYQDTNDVPKSITKTPSRVRAAVGKPLIDENREDLSAVNYGSSSGQYLMAHESYTDKEEEPNFDRELDSNITVRSQYLSSDLKQWQQTQQDDFIQQKQLLRTEPAQYKELYPSLDNIERSPTDDDRHHLDSVLKAAKAIIIEKDRIIEKQKMEIMQFADEAKQYEAKLRCAIKGDVDKEDRVYSRLEELEYKNAELKESMADLKAKKNAEIENLDLKLGATEHELVQLRAVLRGSKPDITSLKSQLAEKEQEVEEWRDKFVETKENQQELKQKLDEVTRYLSDLPPLEESEKQAEELVQLREETELQKETIEDLEAQLMDSRKLLSTRDMEIRDLESKHRILDEKAIMVTEEIQRLKCVGEGAALAQAQEELRSLQEENKRLYEDLDKAKKLLETVHRRSRHLEVNNQNDLRRVEERLAQEEESVMALREEGQTKDRQMQKIKTSIKELATQNQDLMDQNLVLKEQLKQFEQQSSEENRKLQRQFVHEMSVCFSDIQALVQICMQRSKGQDPDMSLLLGVRSNDMDVEEGAKAASEREGQTLRQWLSRLRELRAEVEKLRGAICNKYAEDMGDNLQCNQQ